MNYSRRNLAKLAAGLSGALALTACGVFSIQNGVVVVNLANAQAEANTIYQALATEVTNVASVLPASVQATVDAYLTQLKAAVATFTALPNGTTSYAADAKLVLQIVGDILPVLSPFLGTATVAAIKLGEELISALLNGISTVSVPASVVEAGVKAAKVVPGPIPVPLS